MDDFCTHFWAILGIIWGSVLGSNRSKKGLGEPKRATRSFKASKRCLFKNLKNLQFFSVFGSSGLPREAQEIWEGFKRQPQRYPRVIQNLVKKWSKSDPKTEQKKRFLSSQKSLWPYALRVHLRSWGLFKMLTSKMSSRCQIFVHDA